MKKTIKQLESTIEKLEADKSHWYTKFTELRDDVAKKQDKNLFSIQDEKAQLLNQVGNLLEVVRWLANPKTAESPFLPLKEQREEKRSY